MLKLFSAFLIILLSSKSVAMGDQFYAERSGMDIYSKEVNGKILWDILANYTVKNSEYVGGIKINGFGYRTSYGQDTFRINDFCPEDTPNRATVCFSINRTRYNIDGEKDRFDKYLEQQDVTKLNQLEWFCGFLANNFNEFIIWSKETAANPEYVTDKELAPKLVDFFVAEQTEYEIFGRNCLSAVINAKSKKKEQVAEGTDTNQLLAKTEEIWDLQKKVNELSKTLTTTEGSLQKLRDYSATQLKKMRTEASELKRQNDRLQNKVSQLESTAENLRNENKKLQNATSNDDKSEPTPSTNVDVEYLIKEKSRLGAEKYELSRKLFEVDGELAAAKSKLRQLEAELGLAVSDKDRSTDQLNLSRQREAELRQSISELQNNMNQRELELAKIKDQKKKLDIAQKSRIQKLESSLAQKVQQQDEADARIKNLTQELATFKKRLATSESENTSLSNKALNDSRILSGRISKLQSDKVELRNLIDEITKQRNDADGLVNYLTKELATVKKRLDANLKNKDVSIASINQQSHPTDQNGADAESVECNETNIGPVGSKCYHEAIKRNTEFAKTASMQCTSKSLATAKLFVDPNMTSDIYMDQIGSSWTFVRHENVNIAGTDYLKGHLVSPRGGHQAQLGFVKSSDWKCSSNSTKNNVTAEAQSISVQKKQSSQNLNLNDGSSALRLDGFCQNSSIETIWELNLKNWDECLKLGHQWRNEKEFSLAALDYALSNRVRAERIFIFMKEARLNNLPSDQFQFQSLSTNFDPQIFEYLLELKAYTEPSRTTNWSRRQNNARLSARKPIAKIVENYAALIASDNSINFQICDGFPNETIWKLNDKIWDECLVSIKNKMPIHKASIEKEFLNALYSHQPAKRVLEFMSERYNHEGWADVLINLDDLNYAPKPQSLSEIEETLKYLFELHSLSRYNKFINKAITNFYDDSMGKLSTSEAWLIESDIVLNALFSDDVGTFGDKLEFIKTFKLSDPILIDDDKESYVFELLMNGPIFEWISDASIEAEYISQQSCKPHFDRKMNINGIEQYPLPSILRKLKQFDDQENIFSEDNNARWALLRFLKGCFDPRWEARDGNYKGGNFLHLALGSNLPIGAKRDIVRTLYKDKNYDAKSYEKVDLNGRTPLDVFMEYYLPDESIKINIDHKVLFGTLVSSTRLSPKHSEKLRLSPHYSDLKYAFTKEYRAQTIAKRPPSGLKSSKLANPQKNTRSQSAVPSSAPCKQKQADADAIVKVLRRLGWLKNSKIKTCIVYNGVNITFNSGEVAEFNASRNMLTYYKTQNDQLSRGGYGYCYDPMTGRSYRQKPRKFCWE